jgi:hypothetical protein
METIMYYSRKNYQDLLTSCEYEDHVSAVTEQAADPASVNEHLDELCR